MNTNLKGITGYILAGGKSSRMGADKGLLLLEGKPMIQYVIEQMQLIFDKVVIVSNNPEYKKFGLDVIPDLIKDIGPAGGIYTALHHSGTKFVIRNSEESQVVLLENKGRIEPLFGMYSKECEAIWLKLIEEGKIKLQEMVLNFKFKVIPIENNEIFGANFFKNINTKEDLKNA
jgi:molybdenum cofactor guanylyltransferase